VYWVHKIARRQDGVIADVDAEIASHLEARVRELIDAGWRPDEARAEALRRFGSLSATRDAMYASAHRQFGRARRRERLATILGDLRIALRQLRRAPAFAIGVIATLSLGIAANTAMFDVLDRLLLRPPAHVRDPARVVRVYFHEMDRGAEASVTEVSYRRYREVRGAARDHIDLGGIYQGNVVVGAGEAARLARGGLVTSNFWSMLGVVPALGQFFAEGQEPGPDGDAVVVLGFEYWMTELGGDASALGRMLHIGAGKFQVIGVAPRGFAGVGVARVDFWMPANSARAFFNLNAAWAGDNSFRWLSLIGRLREDVTAAQAASALGGAYHRLVAATARATPNARARASIWPVHLERGPERTDGARVAMGLGAVAAIVLLLACANVGNLMLARALRRRSEIAVRVALGVSRRRLVAQLLYESLILATIAAIVGLALAWIGGSLLRTTLMSGATLADATLNWRLWWFAVVAGFIACLGCGLAPALYSSRPDLAVLVAAAPRSSRRRSRLRTGLLVGQAAMSTTLLVGAGLFVRSLAEARRTDMGFDADRLLVVRLQLRGHEPIPGGAPRLLREFAERLRAVPGVERVATTMQIPFGISGSGEIHVPGIDSIERFGQIHGNPVGQDYFETTGTRIIAGRALTTSDYRERAFVVVVSDSMARALWPRQRALGKCMRIGDEKAPCSEVVGVAANIHQYDVRPEPSLQYWFTDVRARGDHDGPYAVMVRARAPLAMIATVREALTPITPANGFVTIRPITESIERVTRPWRLGAVMFGLFGAIGLVIAAVGLYSVLAYSVDQRRRELGIRVALGAAASRVVGMVVAEGLAVTAAGIAIGLGIALLAGPRLEHLLIGVSPRDAGVLGFVVGALAITAAAASLVPAWRAAHVDPALALRAE
jgi:putative ABC transport system permease protein